MTAKVMTPKEIYEFGSFRLDAEQRLLFSGSGEIPLPPKLFDTLAALVENHGRVLAKDELLKLIWPDTFVEEGSLTRNISTLRRVLGENAEDQEFIQTIPKRGYRFVAPVTEPPVGETLIIEERTRVESTFDVAVEEDATASAVQEPESNRIGAGAGRRRGLGVMTLAMTAFALLVVAGWIFRTQRLWLVHGKPAPIQSIAVLPLENLTGDPSQEFFADGITDVLITDLAHISNLRVISRTSAMQYKKSDKPLPQIAKELGVDAVVEGTVMLSGESVRITTRLFDARTDRNLWADNYEGDLRNVFALQGSVARSVVGEIQARLTPSEQAFLARVRPSVNPTAYENYLKGLFYYNQRDEVGMRKASDYFQRTIELEPNYAPAYAGLSDSHRLLQLFGFVRAAESWPKAKAAAEKALALDDSNAEAHISLAVILWRRNWEWARAQAEFARGLQLNPNYAEGRRAYSVFLSACQDFGESIAQMERARQLDPLSFLIAFDLSSRYYYARRYEQAVVQMQNVLERNPNYAPAYFRLANIYVETGDFSKAFGYLERARQLSNDKADLLLNFGYAYAASGQGGRAAEALHELEQLAKKQYVPPRLLASVYARLGDKDRAFAQLEMAYQERSFLLPGFQADPALANLRSDPRFADLDRRVGMPQCRAV
jgi:TolB-like protein/DNA-binding winged helix-turn-helix (wHTH) protein/Tfp pilus assembly protein PilF